MTTKLILMTCLASTLFMTGLIWFVHVVHYPLFDRVEVQAFRRYHSDHTRTTGYVVILPMFLELVTSLALVTRKLEGLDAWLAWLGLALALASWASTFFLSVPAHQILASGFSDQAYRSLVATNGIRVVTWTSHAIVLLWMTTRALR